MSRAGSWVRRVYHRLAAQQQRHGARPVPGVLRWPALLMLGLGSGVLLGTALGLGTPLEAAADGRTAGLRGEARRVDVTTLAATRARPSRLTPSFSSRPGPPLAAAGRPRIAVVIDDLGLSWNAFERVDALPSPLTLAFLPYGEEAQAMLDAMSPGHEAMLHLPTEPVSRREDAGPDMLRPGDARAIRATLAANLGKLSGYEGVNNHTGSRFTADPAAMTVLLQALEGEGLYFLDSVTTPRPVAARLAGLGGFRVVSRDVFLDADHRAGEAYVRAQLRLLEAVARRNGEAIAIGHPYAATIEALGPWLVTAPARGFDLVTVGELVAPLPEASATLR